MKHRVVNLSNGAQEGCGIANCNNPIKRSVSRKKVDLVLDICAVASVKDIEAAKERINKQR